MKDLRIVILYTPNYAVVPYKIVHDSTKCKDLNIEGHMQVADWYDKQPAEDSETRVFHVLSKVSNKEILKFLNGSMEIATNRLMDTYRKNLPRRGITNRKKIEPQPCNGYDSCGDCGNCKPTKARKSLK